MAPALLTPASLLHTQVGRGVGGQLRLVCAHTHTHTHTCCMLQDTRQRAPEGRLAKALASEHSAPSERRKQSPGRSLQGNP